MATSVCAQDGVMTETKIVSNGTASPSGNRTSRWNDPTVKQIIAAARSLPAPARGGIVLSAISAVLMWASFTPLNFSPLAWVALAPLCLLIRLERAPRLWWLTTLIGGATFWYPSLQWLRLGDIAMYGAWFALAAYLSIYFPLFVGLARVAVHRFGVPLTAAVPLVWVGLEYARAHLLTGFSWYMLGHTQYRWVELIQLSDIFGAYGVSFVVATSSATIAGLVPEQLLQRWRLITPLQLPEELSHLPQPDDGPSANTRSRSRRQVMSVAACLLVVMTSVVYGYVRRSQAQFEPGPRVAMIQGNFISSMKHDDSEYSKIFTTHDVLTGYAVRHKPDIIVWPETMFRWPLVDADPDLSESDLKRVAPNVPTESWRDPYVRNSLTEMSQRSGASMVIGLDRFQADPSGLKHFNSAALITPDRGVASSYDKMHRVIFGEYIPLKESFPWLANFTPLPEDFGISAGRGPAVFRCGKWRVAPVICFEDTVPHLVRDAVRSAGVERFESLTADGQPRAKDYAAEERLACLLNLTNDGWFHGSSELDQHLITASFRAVECRTPMVRAVNSGISVVIDGDGVIREPDVLIDGDATWNQPRQYVQDAGRDQSDRRVPVMVEPVRTTLVDPKTGRWRKSFNGAVIDTVPIDNRRSLYVAYGDWFAGTCSAACGLFLVVGLCPAKRRGIAAKS